jgi:oligopeptidase B
MTIAHRRDLDLDGDVAVLLYGYGAYETSIDPTFRESRLPLLDRGLVYAIAHVRGGGEMGRQWYESGKFDQKPNTFTDYIACAEFLIETHVTAPKRIVARGRSAGGLLMGAIANLRPDLFAGVVAEVPFVDVVTTMLDSSIPLTVPEWEEWGNPQNREHYEVMKSYSPYDNVEAKAYPEMLVIAGFNDPRVQYWEPAKWVAKLRFTATSDRIVLRTDLGSGHGGPSGRYDAWREEAFTQAFVLSTFGIDE